MWVNFVVAGSPDPLQNRLQVPILPSPLSKGDAASELFDLLDENPQALIARVAGA
jgi:hypothetical protein